MHVIKASSEVIVSVEILITESCNSFSSKLCAICSIWEKLGAYKINIMINIVVMKHNKVVNIIKNSINMWPYQISYFFQCTMMSSSRRMQSRVYNILSCVNGSMSCTRHVL